METKGRLLLGALSRYVQLLESYRERIDRLNVFPVPDGDTGTNMYFTVRSAVDFIEQNKLLNEIKKIDISSFKDVARAALLGARGNSGVILAQIISSFCSVFGENSSDELSWHDLKDALVLASKKARSAVLKPVEGTILTVLSDLANLADIESRAEGDFDHKLQRLFDAAQASLQKTPSMLPQLRRAGVVDSGGAGLVLFIASLCLSVGVERFGWGAKIPFLFEASVPDQSLADVVAETDDLDSDAQFHGTRFEVMFVVESNDFAMNGFKDVWAGLGDSIVIVGEDNLYNCHIHTDEIGESIEAGIQAGRVSRIRVTDLAEQIREERWVVDAHGAGAPDPGSLNAVGKIETGVVAIAIGDGVRRIFRSLGVNRIVMGGPSMNPSTEEILKAIEDVPAENVIVLPNSSNVTPVVQLAAEISTKLVRIIPTGGIMEGFSALVEFDPLVGIEQNYERMLASASNVRVAEITRAIRDYDSDVGPVKLGNFIGISRNGLISVSESVVGATLAAIATIVDESAEIITIIEGDGSTSALTRELTEEISNLYPDVAIEIHHGAQPYYPYLIGIE